MKNILITLAVLAVAATATAGDYYGAYNNDSRYNYNSNNFQTKDNYGHWTNQDNQYKDTDRDGVVNRYDYNDRNSNVQRPAQRGYGGYGEYTYGNQGTSRSKRGW